MFTPRRTTTTLACCGPDSADRPSHPHAFRTNVLETPRSDQTPYRMPRHNKPNAPYPLTNNEANAPYSLTNNQANVPYKLTNNHPDIPMNHRDLRSGTPIHLRDLNVVFDDDLSLSDVVLAYQEYCSL